MRSTTLARVALVLGTLAALASAGGAADAPSAPAAPAPAALALRVTGDVEAPRSWTNAQLAAELRSVPWDFRGTRHTSRAVPLAAVVRASRPRVDPAVRRADLAFTVVVQSRDGKVVTFSQAELDATLHDAQAWVALDDDGVALSDVDAPGSLLVSRDAATARWMRGVTRVHVLDAARTLRDEPAEFTRDEASRGTGARAR